MSSDNKSSERGNGYNGPEDMTAESMYAGLVSIFVVAVVLFIGISISLAGNTKCCRKWCKCCRRRREGDTEEGETNAAFTDGPPPYAEVMRTDRLRDNGSSSGRQHVNIFAISGSTDLTSAGSGSTTVLCIAAGDNTGVSGNTGSGTDSLTARQGSDRRSLREIFGNPPNYFDALRNWTSNKIFTSGAQPTTTTNWKSSTPPPKYSDVEKQMEEERQKRDNDEEKRDDDNSAA